MAAEWEHFAGWRPDVCVVDNTFFGDEVTVSGLLTGMDLVRALQALPTDVEDIVLPRGAFGFDGRSTLDGVSAEEVGGAHSGRVHLAATPRELLAILTSPATQ
jgi:NifB/MoaA-like Fe-S oxidoreductase